MFKKNDRREMAVVDVGLVLGLIFILICSSSPPIFYGLFYSPSSSSSSIFPLSYTIEASAQEDTETPSGQTEDTETPSGQTEDTETPSGQTEDTGTDTDTAATELTEDAAVENQPPIADAGPDQTVEPGDTVTLDGTGSSDPDPDGTITSYSWSLVSSPDGSPGITLQQPPNDKPTFTAPQAPGEYPFNLVVTDDKGASSAPDTVVITVGVEPLQGLTPPGAGAQANEPPIADAGDDQTVKPGDTVTLNGAGSRDPDGGTIASYFWYLDSPRAGSRAGINLQPNDEVPNPTFTAPQVAGGFYIFRLHVTDDKGASSNPDRVVIRVQDPSNPNQAPIADAGPNQIVKPGDTVTLDGTRSRDPDGTIASYSWILSPPPTGSAGINLQPNDEAPSPTFTAPQIAGDYLFSLFVTDDKGASSASNFVVIRVQDPSNPNQAPIADAGPNQIVKPGDTVTLNGAGSKAPDGGTIASYSWSLTGSGAGINLQPNDPQNPVRTFTAPQTLGDYTFQLLVTDDKGAFGVLDYVVIRVEPPPSGGGGGGGVPQANQAPIADAGPNQNVKPGDTVTLNGAGSKAPDGGTIASYSWYLTLAPEGGSASISLQEDGKGHATFTAPRVAGDYTFGLIVKDDKGASSAPDTVVIRVATGQPPIADAGRDQTVQPGTEVTLDGTGSSDRDGTIVSYSWYLTSSPIGGSSRIDLKPNSTVASPTFTAPQVAGGVYTFQLIVKDDKGDRSAPDTVVIRVEDSSNPNQNQLPIADAGPNQIVYPASNVTLDGTGSSDRDGTIASYSWTLTSFPDGSSSIDLKPNSTVASPTFTAPQTTGDYTFGLDVTDNDTAISAVDQVLIRVVTNQRPIANAGPDQTVRPGQTVTLNGTGSSDPDGGTIDFHYWYLSQCPDRCVNPIRVQPNNEVANPTFTAPQTPGVYTFELVVVDDAGDYSDTDYVDVRVEPLPSGGGGGNTSQTGGSGGTGGVGGGGTAGGGGQIGIGQQQQQAQSPTTSSTSPATSTTSSSQCMGADLADNANQPQSQIEFTQYENATYGIRIMYPANWTISEFDTKPVVVFSAASLAQQQQQQQNTPTRSPATVILNVNSSSSGSSSLPIQNMTQDQFSADYVTRLMNSTTHYDLLLRNVSGFSNTTSAINGTNQQEAADAVGGQGVQRNSSFAFDTVEYSGTSFVDGCNVRGIDFWTVINGKVYSITYLAVEPLYSTYLPLVQQMVNSFELIAGGDDATTSTASTTSSTSRSSNNIYDTAPR